MSVFGIGVDLVEVDRIQESIGRFGTRFLERVFTRAEQAYCDGHAEPWVYYAARFAAKEAVAKALGTGIGGHAALHEIEVVHAPGGKPEIRLAGSAADYAGQTGVRRILISLSHTRQSAIAQAIALMDE